MAQFKLTELVSMKSIVICLMVVGAVLVGGCSVLGDASPTPTGISEATVDASFRSTFLAPAIVGLQFLRTSDSCGTGDEQLTSGLGTRFNVLRWCHVDTIYQAIEGDEVVVTQHLALMGNAGDATDLVAWSADGQDLLATPLIGDRAEFYVESFTGTRKYFLFFSVGDIVGGITTPDGAPEHIEPEVILPELGKQLAARILAD